MRLAGRRLAATGFSVGLLAPLVAILFVAATPAIAASSDCNIAPDVGIEWGSQAELRNLDDGNVMEWSLPGDPNVDLAPLVSDFYAEVTIDPIDGAALRMELVPGYSYTFCTEFHEDPEDPPNVPPIGDVYLLSETNWGYYTNEYIQHKNGWPDVEEALKWVPVEWRDMIVFLPFRDVHAYEKVQSNSFSTALDSDSKGWISWFGEAQDPSYYLVLDNWNNSRPSDANSVDGGMIVQVWVEVEERLTLPKFTAYLIVGILPISCIVVPLILHSRYHAAGKGSADDKTQLVPLLESEPGYDSRDELDD